MQVSRDQVLQALGTVVEPDTGFSILDLGLVLEADVRDAGTTAVVRVAREPMARRLVDDIRNALEMLDGLMDARLEFVREPAWDPAVMAIPEARKRLDEVRSQPAPLPREEDVRACLDQVIDPELGIPVTELGLIYGVEIDAERRLINVRMTLTSPMCPVGPYIIEAVKQAALVARGVEDATVDLVWDPPWDPHTMATEEARMDLGIY